MSGTFGIFLRHRNVLPTLAFARNKKAQSLTSFARSDILLKALQTELPFRNTST
jgi:hypothetical protein